MITTALLFRMAKACAGPDEPHLTLVTARDRVRYAAWRYGVVRLPADVLDGIPDGIWRLYANGNIRPYDGTFTPEKVRSQLLPLLDQDRTVAVYESPWMCQVGRGMQRILDRSDGLKAVVSQAFWECWEQASPLPMWQLGGRSRPLVWAADKEGRAEALLMPVWKGADTQVPAGYRDAVAAASGADLPVVRIYPVQRKNRRFWRATFPAHPGLDLRGHIECNSLPALRTALDSFAETHGYAVTVQEPPDA